MMKLENNDFLWGLHPSKLSNVEAEIEARFQAVKDPVEALGGYEAAGKLSLDGGLQWEISGDGVAVIPVSGVIRKKTGILSILFGGTSTIELMAALERAYQDKDVKSIVLNVDSPGGTASGIKEVSDFIYANRGRKPTLAHANGMMASAAYWVGSAADQVMAFEDSIVGSIGIVMTHFDFSKRDEKVGVKITRITAGKYKAISSSEKPLSKEGRAYLQDLVDTFYSMFVEDVARNRGVKVNTVLKRMADGRDFVGKQALDAGLVDSIVSFTQAVNLLNETKEGINMKMDRDTLKAEQPDLYQVIYDEGRNSINVEEITKQATAEGLKAERARVIEILDSGAETEAMNKAIKDGKEAAQAYKDFFLAGKKKDEEAEAAKKLELEKLGQKAPESLGHQEPKPGEGEGAGQLKQEEAVTQLIDKAHEIRLEKGCSSDEAMTLAFHKLPEAAKLWNEQHKAPELTQ